MPPDAPTGLSWTVDVDSRWHTAPDLIWTHFDDADDWVVFNPASADVHLINQSAYALWSLLSINPGSSLDQLLSSLAEDETPLDEPSRRAFGAAFESMDRAGLVQLTRS